MSYNKLYQASTLNALMQGDYHGSVAVDDFLKNGDTGLGTFDGLDGEAIFYKGQAYDARANGAVFPMEGKSTIPFGVICRFDEDVPEGSISFSGIEEFTKRIAPSLSSENYFHMVLMKGEFDVRVRSCFRQEEPYLPLYKVAKDQREFEYHGEKGIVVGLFCPRFVSGMNLPGWHLHFLSEDFRHGGHILRLSGKDIRFKTNRMTGWEIVFPEEGRFASMDLQKDLSSETTAVEGQSGK